MQPSRFDNDDASSATVISDLSRLERTCHGPRDIVGPAPVAAKPRYEVSGG